MKNTIILIPGAHHTEICFSLWVAELSKEFDVINTSIPFDINTTGMDVVNYYKEKIVAAGKPVIVLAHSLSAPIAVKLIEEIPDMIADCVLVEPAPVGNFMKSLPFKQVDDHTIYFEEADYRMTIDMEQMVPPPESFVERVTKKYTKRFSDNKLFLDEYEKSLIPMPPQLVVERFNLNDSQLKISNFKTIKNTRFLVVTGTEDPLHIKEDAQYVKNLKKEGLKVEHLELGRKGIKGNGHMMMLEENSAEIIQLIIGWLNGII